MKEFVLLFRNTLSPEAQPTPAQMQEINTSWMNWMGSIAAQNKLANGGNRLSLAGSKTIRPGNVVTDGPYTEVKEFLNGYIIVKANSIDEAVALGQECPILRAGGCVEVRTVVTMEDNS